MSISRSRNRHGIGWSSPILVALCVATLVLTACSSDGEDDPGGQDEAGSVSPGATKEEFSAALADMDPVELAVQLPYAAAGDNQAKPVEAYAEAVTDWSDGKITFEMLYASSRVALTDMPAALASGLVDMGEVLPGAAPQEFPIFDYDSNLLFMHDSSPLTGTLQSIPAMWEVAYNNEPLIKEYNDKQLMPLVPMQGNGPFQGVMCTGDPVTSLDDFEGKRFRSVTASATRQIEMLGGTAVSIPSLETYEALERGVIDCVQSAVNVAKVFGIIPLLDSITLGEEETFSMAPTSFVMGKAAWDDLPLAARQLMWDRLDVYFEEFLNSYVLENIRATLVEATDSGVEIGTWESDVEAAFSDYFDSELESARSEAPAGVDGEAYVDGALDVYADWLAFVEGEITPEDAAVEWADFGEFLTESMPDVGPIVDRAAENILAPNRP